MACRANRSPLAQCLATTSRKVVHLGRNQRRSPYAAGPSGRYEIKSKNAPSKQRNEEGRSIVAWKMDRMER